MSTPNNTQLATSQFKKNAETPVIAPRYSVGQ